MRKVIIEDANAISHMLREQGEPDEYQDVCIEAHCLARAKKENAVVILTTQVTVGGIRAFIGAFTPDGKTFA